MRRDIELGTKPVYLTFMPLCSVVSGVQAALLLHTLSDSPVEEHFLPVVQASSLFCSTPPTPPQSHLSRRPV